MMTYFSGRQSIIDMMIRRAAREQEEAQQSIFAVRRERTLVDAEIIEPKQIEQHRDGAGEG